MEAFCYAVEQCMSYVRELHVTDEVLDADEQRKLIPTVRRFSQVATAAAYSSAVDCTQLPLLCTYGAFVHAASLHLPKAEALKALVLNAAIQEIVPSAVFHYRAPQAMLLAFDLSSHLLCSLPFVEAEALANKLGALLALGIGLQLNTSRMTHFDVPVVSRGWNVANVVLDPKRDRAIQCPTPFGPELPDPAVPLT